MSCCNTKCCAYASLVVGAILVIIGGIATTVFQALFVQIVVQETEITEGTIFYEQWRIVNTPTYMSYYFFNVTNKQQFLDQKPPGSVKLRLEEVGPYTYREYLEKDNIDFLESTEPREVYFRQTTTYIFDRSKSVGDESDMISTVNIIAASIVPIIEYQLGDVLNDLLLNQLLRKLNDAYEATESTLLFTHSVHDILYGFDDPLFNLIIGLIEDLLPDNTTVKLPGNFGLFSTSNISAGWYEYQVYTGKNAPELTNIITEYRNKTELDYWPKAECNKINGTDGTTTPPFLEKENIVYFFVDDVCRSVYARFDEEVTLKRVPGWKYSIPPEIFQSPLSNPDNECFCQHKESILCQHDGAILIESCQAGAPIMISAPHFLYGDGYYLNMTKGISPPERVQHEAALVYEPNTGAAIKADKRLQINLLLAEHPLVTAFDIVKELLLVPVLWLNESATVGQDDADMLYGLLVLPEEVVGILQIVLCVVGGVMFLVSAFYLVVITPEAGRKKNDEKAFEASQYEQPGRGRDNGAYKKDPTVQSHKL